ncbi:nuclear transport factor 2 family protein [Ureibacillus composti]|nr:nuclear transport factor 2 family protein [Ureibacillus composti]
MKNWLIAVMAVIAMLTLAACGDKKEEVLDPAETKEIIDEGTVGFEVLGDKVEEVTDIPKEDKKAILAAFDEYIASFNAKDINRYTNTLSKDPQGFDYEEDISIAKNAFADYDIERVASDVTIVKYTKEQAQVYANLVINMNELESDAKLESSGRQVTVFAKEDDAWKVTSVYYIGNDS